MPIDNDTNEANDTVTDSNVTDPASKENTETQNNAAVSSPPSDQHGDMPSDESEHGMLAEQESNDNRTDDADASSDEESTIESDAASDSSADETADDDADPNDTDVKPAGQDEQSAGDYDESNNDNDGSNAAHTSHVDVPLLDTHDDPIISLRDDMHAAYDDESTESHIPHAVKAAIGIIVTIACAAAVITVTMSFITMEIHPSIAGEESAVEKKPNIDGSGNKVNVTYDVKDALHSFSTDEAPILVWNDNWYSVAKDSEGKQAQSALAAAGSGSTIHLSNGITISVDGRYPCKSSGTAAGIDIDAISKLYGNDTKWVAIRYDASHVLVGKRVEGGETDSANTNESDVTSRSANTDTDMGSSASKDNTASENGNETGSDVNQISGESNVATDE